MRYLVTGTLAAAVADAGTFTVSYPPRTAPENALSVTDEGSFYLSQGHQLMIDSNKQEWADDFTLTLGTSSITVTNKSGATWRAGSSFVLSLESKGRMVFGSDIDGGQKVPMARMAFAPLALISLGAPDALVTDGIAASQSASGAHDLSLNGSLASGGVVVLDTPRNVIVDSGGADTAVLTVYGTDEYGASMRESITLNGATAVAGKKAFKTITRVASSATISNGAFVGTGDVLGLPCFLGGAGYVVKEIEDGAVATGGTFVAGVVTSGGSTATSGDVRGTYDPNSACDGAKVFELLIALPDPGERGQAQYNG